MRESSNVVEDRTERPEMEAHLGHGQLGVGWLEDDVWISGAGTA